VRGLYRKERTDHGRQPAPVAFSIVPKSTDSLRVAENPSSSTGTPPPKFLDRVRWYLRVKDIDFSYNRITILEGKGQPSRITILPARLNVPFRPILRASTNCIGRILLGVAGPSTCLTRSTEST
jgi:hypothetical protein